MKTCWFIKHLHFVVHVFNIFLFILWWIVLLIILLWDWCIYFYKDESNLLENLPTAMQLSLAIDTNFSIINQVELFKASTFIINGNIKCHFLHKNLSSYFIWNSCFFGFFINLFCVYMWEIWWTHMCQGVYVVITGKFPRVSGPQKSN